MNDMKSRFAVLIAGALAFGLATQQPVLAQHDHGGGGMSMPAPTVSVRTGKLTGKLVSKDETSITIEASKAKTQMYMIDSKTSFKGEILPGSEVTVKYQDHSGMLLATAVEAKVNKTKAKD